MHTRMYISQKPVRDIVDAASSKAEKQFPQWKSDLDWGWSLMFYGVGSKRDVGIYNG